MPNIKDDSTVEAIAREYCSNGRNKEQALKAIGYKHGYAEGRGHSTVFGNDRVKSAIARIDAESAKEQGMTLARMHAQYDEDRAFAIANRQPSACISASVATARLYGMDKDNKLDTGDTAPPTQDQIYIGKAMAKAATDAEAKARAELARAKLKTG